MPGLHSARSEAPFLISRILVCVLALAQVPEAIVRAQTPMLASKPFSWQERLALEIGEVDEVGELEAGKFALLVDAGRTAFVAIEHLKPVPDGVEYVGKVRLQRSLTADERKSLTSGSFEEKQAAFNPQFLNFEIVFSAGGSQPAKLVKWSGDRLEYLRPDDAIEFQPAPRGTSRKLSSDSPLRVMPMDTVSRILLPTNSQGIRRGAYQYDRDRKQLVYLAHYSDSALPGPPAKRGPRAEVSLAGSSSDMFDYTSTQRTWIADTFPDGLISIVTLGKRPTGRVKKGPFGTVNDEITWHYHRFICHPEFANVVTLLDGSSFRYDESLKAYVHEASSPMPLTQASLRRISRERQDWYHRIADAALIPKAFGRLEWTNLSSEEKLDFKSSLQRITPSNGMEFLAETTFGTYWDRLDEQAKWRICSTLDTFDQLEMPTPVGDVVRNAFLRRNMQMPPTTLWNNLDIHEQLALHHVAEIRLRNVAKQAQTSKLEKFALFGLTVGAAIAHTAGAEYDRRVRNALKDSFSEGDIVFSLVPQALGGWEGRIIDKVTETKYRIKITQCLDQPSRIGQTEDFFKGEFRH